MRVGFVGCGKLGLMVALTIESCGHEVKGFDVNPEVSRYLAERRIPFQEEHSEELLARTRMQIVGIEELCDWADIIFIAVQTPHHPQYEGTTPLPETREDFSYAWLRHAVRMVAEKLKSPKPCVVISTVLPGTIEREIYPLLTPNFRLVYSPQFIAMGTVYDDFLNPEFWLIGSDDEEAAEEVARFFSTLTDRHPLEDIPVVKTDIKTAEGIKVFYNTFITTKTVLANLYGELAHKTGMDVDDIYKALALSTKRLISPRYLKAGMGDGGGCHPRDNIALSWLAREVNLSYDYFSALMLARERHATVFLADLVDQNRFVRSASREKKLPVVILGRAFKPETNIETGSPSLLLSHELKRRGIDHICENDCTLVSRAVPALYFIGTKHDRYRYYQFAKGSVVIDPFRYIPDQDGVRVVRIGEGVKKAVYA